MDYASEQQIKELMKEANDKHLSAKFEKRFEKE